MNIKVIIILVVSYAYGFFEVLMHLKRNRNTKTIATSRKNSAMWLYGLITVGYFLSFSIGATKIGRIYNWNTLFALGMVLFGIGLMIRIHSIRTLNHFFTYSVTRVENHFLVGTGLYKTIRHPGYLGQLIIFIGISISISNWISILAMTVPVTLGYLYRIDEEEKFLLEQFGMEYLNYQKSTKRLIPMIY